MKKNNKNLYLIILCIVALIFLILTVFLHVNKQQKTLRVSINKPITTLDISKAVNHNDLTVLLNTEEGLYRLNKDNIPQKALAKKVKVYDNGTKWIITLRKAYWNNGQRITANDFVYSWRRTNTLQMLHMLIYSKILKMPLLFKMAICLLINWAYML